MSNGNDIQQFWDNKPYYINKETLLQKAKEHFTEDLISNYSAWKVDLLEFNKMMSDYLISVEFEMEYWSDMTYDELCKHIINNIEQWIITNSNIEKEDIPIIYQSIIDDHITRIIEDMNSKKYTISSLMQSIKTVKA